MGQPDHVSPDLPASDTALQGSGDRALLQLSSGWVSLSTATTQLFVFSSHVVGLHRISLNSDSGQCIWCGQVWGLGGPPGSWRRRQRIVECGRRPRPPVSGARPRASVSQNGWRGQLIGDRAASRRPRLFGEKQSKMELSPSADGQGWASLWPSQPLPRQAPSSVLLHVSVFS